jgi:hypothetical protein
VESRTSSRKSNISDNANEFVSLFCNKVFMLRKTLESPRSALSKIARLIKSF